MSRASAVLAVLVLAFPLSSCNGGDSDASPVNGGGDGSPRTGLRVGVTLPLFADFVREVAGDYADVFAILPAGADPHTYEPTPSDIENIAGANIIFVNDTQPGVEGSVLGVIDDSKGKDTTVVSFAASVPSSADPEVSAAEAGDNPHLWLDPTLAQAYATTVSDALVAEDGANADYYRANLADYSDRLSHLDQELAAAVEGISADRRLLVTVHDAFAHLARRYGLDVVGFLVAGPGQDPSPRDVADLTRAIEDRNVPAVFGEPQIGPETDLLERIAGDTRTEMCTLYSDTLDDRVSTYEEMMRFNMDELVRCLEDGRDG